MKAAEMHCIKMSDAYEYEALSKQPSIYRGDGSSIRFLPLHLWVVDARRVTICILQEAGGVDYTSAICDTPPYTPPR
jgi:hypothetical protein